MHLGRQSFLVFEVTSINYDRFRTNSFPRLLRHLAQLVADRAHVGDLVSNDQMVLGIERRLYVLADDATAVLHHQADIKVSQ